MVLTKKKTEIAEETNQGFSTKPVAKSYFAPLFEADQDQEAVFEVEKEYQGFDSPKVQKKNPILPEFDIVPKAQTRSIAKEESDVEIRLSTRGKIIAITASLIVVLLLTMVIYNAVILGAKTSEIVALSSQIAIKQEEIAVLEQALVSSESEASVNEFLSQNASTLRKATSADRIVVNAQEFAVEETEIPTNWFDKLCEFLSNLF